MSSEMRELIAKWRSEVDGGPDRELKEIGYDACLLDCADELAALLTRTEAGAVKCSDCDGDGETCLAGRSAHRSNWIKCAKCNGTGDAAPVADGLYAWVRESPRHWERVTESDLSQPADPQKMRAGGWFPVYTHPQDASGDAAKLGAFAASILNLDEDWIGDVDGGTLQDAAEKHGLLQPVEVTESCGENCACAGYGDFPQTCYRPTETMKRAIAAMQAKEAK